MVIKDVVDAKILAALGAQLSFAAAARQLGVPPASVSRRVAEMERGAGLRLFDRTTRAVTVTEAGQIAIEHAARILAEIDGVHRSLEERRGAALGRVRVSTPVILGHHLFGPIVADFLAEHPGCDVTLDLSNRRVDLVEERFDFVIRVRAPGDKDLIAQSIGVGSAGLYQAHGASVGGGRMFRSPSDIEHCEAGLLRSDDVKRSALRLTRDGAENAFCVVRARLIALNPWLLVEAAKRSGLLVVLPSFVGDPLVASRELEPVLPEWRVVASPINVLYTSKQYLRPAAAPASTSSCVDCVTR